MSCLQIYDDNFCDFSDGRDEHHSSACSHVTPAVKFTCADFTSRAYTIPTSRVNDGTVYHFLVYYCYRCCFLSIVYLLSRVCLLGVCDCCDGSDEYGSEPWIPLCPITCGFPVAESLKSNMKMIEKLAERRKYPILVVSTTAASTKWTRIAGVVHRHSTRFERGGIDYLTSVGMSQDNSSDNYVGQFSMGSFLRQRSSAESVPSSTASLNSAFRFPNISGLDEASLRMKHAFSSLNALGIGSSSASGFNDWSNRTVSGEWTAGRLLNHTIILSTVTHSHMKAAHEAAAAWITWARADIYSAVMFSCMVIAISISCYFFGQCVLRPCFRRHQKQDLMSLYASRAHMVLERGSSKLRRGASDDGAASTCDLTRDVSRKCVQWCNPIMYACWSTSSCKCCSVGNCCRSYWCSCCSRLRKQIVSSTAVRNTFPLSTKSSTDAADASSIIEGKGFHVRTASAVSRDNLTVLTHRQSAATAAATPSAGLNAV